MKLSKLNYKNITQSNIILTETNKNTIIYKNIIKKVQKHRYKLLYKIIEIKYYEY